MARFTQDQPTQGQTTQNVNNGRRPQNHGKSPRPPRREERRSRGVSTRRLPRGKQQRGDNHRLNCTYAIDARRARVCSTASSVAVRFISRRSEAIDTTQATGEVIFVALAVSWIVTYFYNPAIIESNPLKDRLGYNNPWTTPGSSASRSRENSCRRATCSRSPTKISRRTRSESRRCHPRENPPAT